MKTITGTELTPGQKRLIEEAARTLENAYSPYSRFEVGAALLSEDGTVITGANFENASYGGTLCAERSALVSANAGGKRLFQSIAVIARSDGKDVAEPAAPCGICRQLLFEASQLSGHDIEVILSNTKMDKIILTSIHELLPLAFGPVDLGMNLEKYRKG